jgi:hypothetical protein
MKTQTILLLPLALAGAAALLTQTTSAQTWQTVDDFQFALGFDSVAQCIAKDPTGNLYSAGYSFNPTTVFAVINKSSDGGTNWSVIDDFTNGDPTNSGFEYYGITVDAAGRLYAVGDDFWSANNDFQLGGWFVRESLDGGQNWSTVDAFTLGGSSTAYGVGTDTAGNVYVVGSAYTANYGSGSWIVRKGTVNGSGAVSWATVDKFAPGGGGSAAAVFCHPTAGIFVVGVAFGGGKKGTSQQWYVRRSLNGGATWANVDTYLGGSATGIGADALGHLYVVGTIASRYGSHWIVRKGTSGGTSWATVDDFSYGVPRAFSADANGNLFVVGGAQGRWTVRENPGGVGSWLTVDSFQYASGIQTEPYGTVADNSGQVFVAGYASPVGAAHWLVRKN